MFSEAGVAAMQQDPPFNPPDAAAGVQLPEADHTKPWTSFGYAQPRLVSFLNIITRVFGYIYYFTIYFESTYLTLIIKYRYAKSNSYRSVCPGFHSGSRGTTAKLFEKSLKHILWPHPCRRSKICLSLRSCL